MLNYECRRLNFEVKPAFDIQNSVFKIRSWFWIRLANGGVEREGTPTAQSFVS
jgi:hypothetical protein